MFNDLSDLHCWLSVLITYEQVKKSFAGLVTSSFVTCENRWSILFVRLVCSLRDIKRSVCCCNTNSGQRRVKCITTQQTDLCLQGCRRLKTEELNTEFHWGNCIFHPIWNLSFLGFTLFLLSLKILFSFQMQLVPSGIWMGLGKKMHFILIQKSLIKKEINLLSWTKNES